MPLGTRVVLKMGIVTVFFFALLLSRALSLTPSLFTMFPHFLSLLTFHPSHLQMAFLLF